MDLEFKRNKERFAFLKWGSTAFRNMLVVPPGSGIVHQVSQISLVVFMIKSKIYFSLILISSYVPEYLPDMGACNMGITLVLCTILQSHIDEM